MAQKIIPHQEGTSRQYFIQPAITLSDPYTRVDEPTIGITHVPDGDYGPLTIAEYTVKGTKTDQDTGRERPVYITCTRPITFWPPVCPGQRVAAELVARARLAGSSGVIEYGSDEGTQYIVTPITGKFDPDSDARRSPADYFEPLMSFGGRKKRNPPRTIPHQVPIPPKVRQGGKVGYKYETAFERFTHTLPAGSGVDVDNQHVVWGEQAVMAGPPKQRLFVPETRKYHPIHVTPGDLQARVEAQDPQAPSASKITTVSVPNVDREYRYWPPRLPGQRVKPHLHHKAAPTRSSSTGAQRTELADYPLPEKEEVVRYPYEHISDEGVPGHVHLVRFKPIELPAPRSGMSKTVDGEVRYFASRVPIGIFESYELFVPYKDVYTGAIIVKPPPTYTARFTLVPMAGEVMSTEIVGTTDEDLRFAFYPKLIPGQKVLENDKAWAASLNDIRTTEVLDGNRVANCVDRSEPFTGVQVRRIRQRAGKKIDLRKFAVQNRMQDILSSSSMMDAYSPDVGHSELYEQGLIPEGLEALRDDFEGMSTYGSATSDADDGERLAFVEGFESDEHSETRGRSDSGFHDQNAAND